MATARVENDSGFGSTGISQVDKQLLTALSEEVSNAVIALYNKNSNNGEADDVADWAADRVKKLSAHAAKDMAAKIIKEIQGRRKKAGSDAIKAMTELLMNAMKDGNESSGSSSGLTDSSTSEIKYPWQKKGELGRGAFGVVFRAQGPDGFQFAIKEVEKIGPEADCLREEIKCLIKLSHPNIVKCYGFAEGRGKIYMYLELMKGSLMDKMNSANEPCRTAEARLFTTDIVRGLAYLHGNNMIHRDIKCANVLVDASGRAKLGDMGLTKSHMQQTVADYNECGGTVLWMSPEALSERKTGKRADIWSMACTVYEMLKRVPPFADKGILAVMVIVSSAKDGCSKHKQLINDDETFSRVIKTFLLQMFVPFEERPFIETVAKHEWLN